MIGVDEVTTLKYLSSLSYMTKSRVLFAYANPALSCNPLRRTLQDLSALEPPSLYNFLSSFSLSESSFHFLVFIRC